MPIVTTRAAIRRQIHGAKSLIVEGWTLFVWLRIPTSRDTASKLVLAEKTLERKHVAHTPPQLQSKVDNGIHTHFQEGFGAINKILFDNLRLPSPLSKYRYATPAPAFTGVYLWDSAFIAQIWRWWDPETAIEILRAVVELRKGDRLQHVVKDYGSSRLTQPPLLTWSLATIALDDWNDTTHAIVEELYPALASYHGWLFEKRRLHNGLFAWAKPYESGIDNSPRFSNRTESKRRETTTLASSDFSSYMILDSEALAKLAERLGYHDDVKLYVKHAQEIRNAMRKYLWHQEDGLYYDRDLDGTWVRSRTIASLMPLWAGVPNKSQALRLRKHILDPNSFGTLIPLPSVAANDPSFELDMWRGPVWINTAYMILLGLKRYGFDQEAAELAWRLADGVYHVFTSKKTIYEFYDPNSFEINTLSRKRGNIWKHITLGTGPQQDFVGWSGLVNSMLVEMLFGFSRRDGNRILRPTFPPAAVGASFRLTLPKERLTIELVVKPGQRVQGTIIYDSKDQAFITDFNEVIAIDP